MDQKNQALTVFIIATTIAVLGSIFGSTMGNLIVSIVCSVVALVLLGYGAYLWRKSQQPSDK